MALQKQINKIQTQICKIIKNNVESAVSTYLLPSLSNAIAIHSLFLRNINTITMTPSIIASKITMKRETHVSLKDLEGTEQIYIFLV